MSIERCEAHDRDWDSDFHAICPACRHTAHDMSSALLAIISLSDVEEVQRLAREALAKGGPPARSFRRCRHGLPLLDHETGCARCHEEERIAARELEQSVIEAHSASRDDALVQAAAGPCENCADLYAALKLLMANGKESPSALDAAEAALAKAETNL